MIRHHGGTAVKRGFYLDRAAWEITVIPSPGGVLPGTEETRYTRVPAVALFVLAPLLGALYVVLPVVTEAYRWFRGNRTILCPETRSPADIRLDAGHAALTAAVGNPSLRLTDCSQWPERQDCEQECLKQIA